MAKSTNQSKRSKKQPAPPAGHQRSVCPVACTLDLIGDKWTLLIIRDLEFGRSHFKDFGQSPEGIATNILANRLGRLVEHGIAEKYPSPIVPGRDAYRLTAKGKALRPVLKAVATWGLEHVPGSQALMKPKA